MELGLIPVLEDQVRSVKDQPKMQKMIDLHLQSTRKHAQLLKDRLEGMGERVSNVKPLPDAGAIYRKPDGMSEERAFSNTLSGYVTESFEAASYRALSALARHLNDHETARIADEILQDELRAVQGFGDQLPDTKATTAMRSTAGGEIAGLARKAFDALNEHNLDKWSQCVSDSFRSEAPGAVGVQNKTEAREYNQIFINAFPDLRFTITQIISEGDRAAVHWEATGTHKGQLRTPTGDMIPPTGKQVKGVGCTILEGKGDKLTRGWIFWDMVSLLHQLDMMPAGQTKITT
jgi:ferritin-like metal-binding protein YciE/predicted ester cyclase